MLNLVKARPKEGPDTNKAWKLFQSQTFVLVFKTQIKDNSRFHRANWEKRDFPSYHKYKDSWPPEVRKRLIMDLRQLGVHFYFRDLPFSLLPHLLGAAFPPAQQGKQQAYAQRLHDCKLVKSC